VLLLGKVGVFEKNMGFLGISSKIVLLIYLSVSEKISLMKNKSACNSN
jgi:hypothetical protein